MRKTLLLALITMFALVQLPCFSGCSSNDDKVSPEQLDEARQQHMKRADDFRRHGPKSD